MAEGNSEMEKICGAHIIPESFDLANYQPRAKEIADYYTHEHAGKKTDLHHLNAPYIERRTVS